MISFRYIAANLGGGPSVFRWLAMDSHKGGKASILPSLGRWNPTRRTDLAVRGVSEVLAGGVDS